LPADNLNYPSDNVRYSLDIEKPSSWFDYNPVHGSVVLVNCIVDGKQNITANFDYDKEYYNKDMTLTGTLDGLSEGKHTLQVYVLSDSFYRPPGDLKPPNPFRQIAPFDYWIDTYSKIVTFYIYSNTSNITNSPTQQPTPISTSIQPDYYGGAVDYTPAIIMWSVLAGVIAVGVVSYFYFKKRGR